jgi:hypothetical protein
MSRLNLKDAQLKVTRALPNGAAAVTSTAIDTQNSSLGDQPGDVEFLISAPAMGTTPMADAKTMIYDVIHSDNADLSSPVTLVDNIITQTGAGSAGCAAATKRFRLPSDAKRYIGFTATGSASGDATGSSATLEALV